MISVAEARNIIDSNIPDARAEMIPLEEAAGFVLAEDMHAQMDIPSFDQSAMDGYAIRFDERNNELSVDGEMPAGAEQQISLRSGAAVRIFTGGPVPTDADTVVMQEKTAILDNRLRIRDELLVKGKNIRSRGSEIRKGALALKNGTVLTPAAAGFLAGIGFSKVPVYTPPAVSLIITGKELIQPGSVPGFGQVYESNSYALNAALDQMGITKRRVQYADDSLPVLQSILERELVHSEIVILTGGVSVGDYDFVLQAAENNGVNKLFHKIKQKPGKPLYFGMKGNKCVFGLPGNPSSVLTCFYEYVVPVIEKRLNKPAVPRKVKAVIDDSYHKPAGLTHFLKGFYTEGTVNLLPAQESYRMSSFAIANCFIQIAEHQTIVEKGEEVEVHLFSL